MGNQTKECYALWEKITKEDVNSLNIKDKEYGRSWVKRGGRGAFFITARKWDRLEVQVEKHGYDIFVAAAADTREEGILDDIRDLRRYLLLIEAEILEQQPALAAKRCVPRTIGPRGYDPIEDAYPITLESSLS